MMRNECDHLIDYFNNQLSEDEERAFDKHLETCEDCRGSLEELQMLTMDLPFVSEPVDPPREMKGRILEAVFSKEPPAYTEEVEEQPATNKEQDRVIPIHGEKKEIHEKKIFRKKPAWIMGGLVAALILSIAGNLYAVMNGKEEARPEKEQTEKAKEDGTDQVVKSVKLQGEAKNATASATFIQQQKGDILTLQAEQLKPLQGNEVYQVWLIQGEKPYRAGTFVANKNGEGAVSYSLKNLPKEAKWDAVAISKEPDSTSQTPQGEVILSSEL